MKTTKRFLNFVLAGVLALGLLTGCGSAAQDAPKGTVDQVLGAFNAGRKAVGLPLLENTYGDVAAGLLELFDRAEITQTASGRLYVVTADTVELPEGFALYFVDAAEVGDGRSTYTLRESACYSRLQGYYLRTCVEAGFLIEDLGIASKVLDGNTYCVVVCSGSGIGV